MSRIPGFHEASAGVRAILQDMQGTDAELRTDVDGAAAGVSGLGERVTALESAAPGASPIVRTVIRLTAADVAALGAVAGPVQIELAPLLPAFSTLINATAHVVTPFASSVVGYTLQASTLWRANDSAPPDAVPLDMAPIKTLYNIGSDTTTVSTWEGFGTAAQGNPFDAETTSNRWPYTPTLVIELQEVGAGGATMDTYTDGLLEITILSITMQ